METAEASSILMEEDSVCTEEAPVCSEETPVCSEETPVCSEEAPVCSKETCAKETVSCSKDTSGRYFSMFEKQGYYKDDAVYLNAGAPGTEMLRMLPPIIEAATSYQMNLELEGTAQLFQYGEEQGNWQFRSFLATFLSEQYGGSVDCEKLFLTGGASCGLWLILSCFFSPGIFVFIEDPSYFCVFKMFSDFKMKMIPVKTDQDGLVIEDLEEKFQQYLGDAASVHGPPLQALLYLITVYHNPTGCILSKDRCKRVITLARKFNVMVVCDDVYNLLHYDESSICPRRLFAFDNESDSDYVGNVISNGSFSKILGPGLRIGWLEAPKWAIKKLANFGVLYSGGGLNTFTAGIITSLFALGKMNVHLQKVKNLYKTHMEATALLLSEELPPGCELKSPAKGGYFLWISLPETIDASQLLLFTKKEYQVAFTPGIRTSPSDSFRNYIRLCVTFYPLNVLLSAVRRLCQAIADFQVKAENDPDFWKEYE